MVTQSSQSSKKSKFFKVSPTPILSVSKDMDQMAMSRNHLVERSRILSTSFLSISQVVFSLTFAKPAVEWAKTLVAISSLKCWMSSAICRAKMWFTVISNLKISWSMTKSTLKLPISVSPLTKRSIN